MHSEQHLKRNLPAALCAQEGVEALFWRKIGIHIKRGWLMFEINLMCFIIVFKVAIELIFK